MPMFDDRRRSHQPAEIARSKPFTGSNEPCTIRPRDEGIFMIQAVDTTQNLSRRRATMTDATADWSVVLSAMSDAFSTGDNPRGEELLWSALDLGAPWDLTTSTAAQALSRRPMPSNVGSPTAVPA
jgi:hypothetical protein